MAEGVRFSIYVQPYESYTKTIGAVTLDEYSVSADTETAYKQLDDVHSYGKSKILNFAVAQPYNNSSTFPKNIVNIENIDTATVTLVENLMPSMGDRLEITSSPVALLATDPASEFDMGAIYIKNTGSYIAQLSVDSGSRYDIELNPGQAFFSRLYDVTEGEARAKAKSGGQTTYIEYILFKGS